MGNPAFYYYPDPDGSLERVDLGMGLSSLIVTPVYTVREAKRQDGYTAEVLAETGWRVRIILDRFQTAGIGRSALERQLLTMERHLLIGGRVGFSKDHSKTWAAITTGLEPTRGDTTVAHGGNGFGGWSLSGGLAAGDEVVIERGSPDYYGELTTVSSLTASVLTPVDALRYTYPFFSSASHPLIRYRDFWPVMRLPAGERNKAIVTDDHRLNWTLDVTLEYCPAESQAMWSHGNNYSGSPTGGSFGGALVTISLRDSTVLSGGASTTIQPQRTPKFA